MVEPRWPQNKILPGQMVPKSLEGGSGPPLAAAQLAAGTSPQPPLADRGAGGGGAPLAPAAVAAYAKRANVPVPVMAELLQKTQDGTLTAPDMMAVMGVPPIYLPKELGGLAGLRQESAWLGTTADVNPGGAPGQPDVLVSAGPGIGLVSPGAPVLLPTGAGPSPGNPLGSSYTAFFQEEGGGGVAVEVLQVRAYNQDKSAGIEGSVNVFLKSNCRCSLFAQTRTRNERGVAVPTGDAVKAPDISLADLQRLLGRFVGTPAFKLFLQEVEAQIQRRGGPSARDAFRHWDESPEVIEANERDSAEEDPDPILRKLRLIRIAHRF